MLGSVEPPEDDKSCGVTKRKHGAADAPKGRAAVGRGWTGGARGRERPHAVWPGAMGRPALGRQSPGIDAGWGLEKASLLSARQASSGHRVRPRVPDGRDLDKPEGLRGGHGQAKKAFYFPIRELLSDT